MWGTHHCQVQACHRAIQFLESARRGASTRPVHRTLKVCRNIATLCTSTRSSICTRQAKKNKLRLLESQNNCSVLLVRFFSTIPCTTTCAQRPVYGYRYVQKSRPVRERFLFFVFCFSRIGHPHARDQPKKAGHTEHEKAHLFLHH